VALLQADRYDKAVDGLEIGPAVGSCGTATYRREAIIVSDIAADPLWGVAELRARWSMPILVEHVVVLGTVAICFGTVTICYREMRGRATRTCVRLRSPRILDHPLNPFKSDGPHQA
jgi:hypothetical protein